jgi:hypothetical protein
MFFFENSSSLLFVELVDKRTTFVNFLRLYLVFRNSIQILNKGFSASLTSFPREFRIVIEFLKGVKGTAAAKYMVYEKRGGARRGGGIFLPCHLAN